MIASKWFDLVVGVDIHWVLVPAPPAPPVPLPLPHPYVGLVFEGLAGIIMSAVTAAAGSLISDECKGLTLINMMPAASTGTDGTNLLVMPHFPMPPGIGWAPVPAAPKPFIPGRPPDPGIPGPIPSNDATLITGSKTVYINGTNACRLGDIAMSCGEPVRLPSSTVIALPLGAPVIIGGPPALDFTAVGMSFIKSSWFSNRLHKLMKAPKGSRRSKTICFFTGHPVDVATGKVLTDHIDLDLPGPIPFKLERTYCSDSDYNGPFGYGWGHSYDQFISFEEDRIVLHEGEGREIYFDPVISEGKTRNHFERMDLELFGDSVIVTTKDNLKYCFGQCGRDDNRLYLLKIEDFNESILRLTYNENGFLSDVHDSAGRRIGIINDENGRITSINVPHPQEDKNRITVLRYEYSMDGDLSVVYDAFNNEFSYKYKHHLLVQETNRNGLSFYFAYDGIDKDAACVRTWGDNGIYDHILNYDKQNHITLVENSLGNKTTYFMDQDSAVIKILNPNGSEISYEYDEHSRKVMERDPIGNETRFEYDKLGNICKKTDPDGTVIQSSFNEHNLPVKSTDKMGGSWKWEYDERLRIISRTDPLGRKSRFIYQGKTLFEFIDPAGGKNCFTVDAHGNLLSLITPDGMQTRWRYDNLGNCLETIDSLGNRQLAVYDVLNRVIQVNDPDGNTRSLSYDQESNIIRILDKLYDVKFEYGGLNKITSRIQNNTKIQFIYDTEERLTAIRNEQGSVYKFELNESGDVAVESGFDGTCRRYVRDPAGRVEQVERPDGIYTFYKYDSLDRVTSISNTDDSREFFTYRPDGLLIETKNDKVVVKFERDILGNIIKEWQDDYWVESKYDDSDLRISMRSSIGAAQIITRNIMGDVQKIAFGNTGNDYSIENSFKRDAFGLETHRDMPGGVQSKWERDKLGRPIEQSISTASGYNRTRAYSWDINDRLRSIQDSLTGSTTFSHDAFGNLASAKYSNGTELLRMPDAVGNLFKTSDRNDRKYGPAGQLIEIYSPQGSTLFDYDPEGNRTSKTEPDGKTWRYRWNASGMMIETVSPDGEKSTFTYDSLGRRVSKNYRDKTTKWIWDGNVILHEWVESDHAIQAAVSSVVTNDISYNSKVPYPVYFNTDSYKTYQRMQANISQTESAFESGTKAEPVTWVFAQESITPLAKLTSKTHYSIITDQLGTPLAMFDRNGENCWILEMDIYGQVRSILGKKDCCPFRYPGQYEDMETGLYYNRFRYYDPQTGDYVSQDPIGLMGGLAFYSYVFDPLNGCDPLGLAFSRLFKPHEVSDILDASEGRASPATGAPGHPRSRHVRLSDNDLLARTRTPPPDTATSFQSMASQNRAATAALNSAEGQAQLAKFDSDPNLKRVTIKAETPAEKIRISKSSSRRVRTIRSTKTTVIVDRLPGSGDNIHVQTCH